jgi:hypothetical protein
LIAVGVVADTNLSSTAMTNTTTKRAVIATVDLGFKQIEGLMLPDGTYAVGVSQLARLFSFDTNQASRKLKPLLGKDFKFPQAASELNSKKVNILNIADVTRLIYELAKQGNPIADEFMYSLVEEGLDRRFAKAFNQRITDDEYNARLRQRMDRILARYQFTDFIRDRYFELHGEKAPAQLYKDLTIMVNLALFNRRHFFCDRDNMTDEQQRMITTFENVVSMKAKQHPNKEPKEIIELSINVVS